MSEFDFPAPNVSVATVRPSELKDRIDEGEPVTVLDTRAPDEVEKWSIDGANVETINVPYYEFLVDEPEEELFEPIPEDREVTAVCAKGQSSEYVAGLVAERGYDVNHLAEGMNGWARIYESREIETSADATMLQYQRPSSGCLAYLVVSGDEAAVVDPLRAFADEYAADARERGAAIEYVLDTHVHADHVSGIRTVAAETGAKALVPERAAARGIDYETDYATVGDGDELTLGNATIEVVHTPGHTSGMTSYRVGDVLLTGDTLFTDSVARPDLEEGEDGAPEAAGTLYEALQDRILPLPDETIVAPAHFGSAARTAPDGTYTATLGNLREHMNVLGMDRDEFVSFVLSDMPPRPANYEDIIATNLGRTEVDDERAFEMELGPNNCAASDAANE